MLESVYWHEARRIRKGVNNITQGDMGLVLQCNASIYLALMTLLPLMFQQIFAFFSIILWLAFSDYPYHFRTTPRKFVHRWMGIILILAGMQHWLGLFSVAYIRYDQARNRGTIERLMGNLEDQAFRLRWIKIPVTYHSGNKLVQIFNDIEAMLFSASQMTRMRYIEPKYMGPHGIDSEPRNWDFPPEFAPARAILSSSQWDKIMNYCVIGFLLAALITVAAYTHIYIVIVIVIMIWTAPTAPTPKGPEGAPVPMKEGIYLLRDMRFGTEFCHGIGFVTNGVMHAPFHLVGHACLRWGTKDLPASFIEGDVACYGGYPQFKDVNPGDVLVANAENPNDKSKNYHGSYYINYELDEGLKAYSWSTLSVPGESGSPIYRMNPNGNLEPVGMVGSNYHETSWFKNPISSPSEETDVNLTTGLKKITSHPGSGKTRKVIPKYVDAFLKERRGHNKVFILAPTRVVANEIYQALQRKYGPVMGLAILDSGILNSPGRPIQVTTHATFLNIIRNNNELNVQMMIVDEAHVENSATAMCRHYAEELAERGNCGILLSATLDGISNRGSNFNIRDERIEERDIDEVIRRELENGNRILVFFAGKARCDRYVKKLSTTGHVAYSLHSSNYSKNIKKIMEGEYDILFATNIAECGFNATLDVVVDCSKEYDFYDYGDQIIGELHDCSSASSTQRRGRVGRSKPGVYYYVEKRELGIPPKAYIKDAEVMMKQRDWAPNNIPNHGYQLSEAQYNAALAYGITPRMAYCLFGIKGTANSFETVRRNIIDMYVGKEGTIAPPIKELEAMGIRWKFYDEREENIYQGILKQRIELSPYTGRTSRAELLDQQMDNGTPTMNRIREIFQVGRDPIKIQPVLREQ